MGTTNKVILVGHVGRDPDVRETARGTEAYASLLTLDPHDDDREEWHRLLMLDRLACFTKAEIRAGDRLYIEGRLRYDTYERDGAVYSRTKIVVREIVILRPDGKASGEQDRASLATAGAGG